MRRAAQNAHRQVSAVPDSVPLRRTTARTNRDFGYTCAAQLARRK
jgi:hypothetical protein